MSIAVSSVFICLSNYISYLVNKAKKDILRHDAETTTPRGPLSVYLRNEILYNPRKSVPLTLEVGGALTHLKCIEKISMHTLKISFIQFPKLLKHILVKCRKLF